MARRSETVPHEKLVVILGQATFMFPSSTQEAAVFSVPAPHSTGLKGGQHNKWGYGG